MKLLLPLHKLAPESRDLAVKFTRVGLVYLIIVGLLWVLGIESINQHLTPFYALVRPTILHGENILWHVQSILVLSAALFCTHKFLCIYNLLDESEPDTKTQRRFIGWCFLLAVAVPISIAMMRGGLEGISGAYSRPGYEYISDIGVGGSIRGLFNKFEYYHKFLSMHGKVHPPGPTAILWLMSYVLGTSPLMLSFGTIFFGATSVIPFYYWMRELFSVRVAVHSTLVYIFVPTIVLFTATSADILFMPFTLTTLWFFWRSITRGSLRYALGAGVCYALCTLLSFSLISLGAFFGLVGLWKLVSSETRLHVIITASGMIVGLIATHFLVYFWADFNVLHVFELSKNQFDLDQKMLDIHDPRYPSWVFKFLNPLCWIYFAGIPVSVLALKQLFVRSTDHRPVFIIIGITLLILDLLYLARGEGERSAMYVMPFIVIPAGYCLAQVTQRDDSAQALTLTLVFLAIQCWVTEAVLYTYW